MNLIKEKINGIIKNIDDKFFLLLLSFFISLLVFYLSSNFYITFLFFTLSFGFIRGDLDLFIFLSLPLFFLLIVFNFINQKIANYIASLLFILLVLIFFLTIFDKFFYFVNQKITAFMKRKYQNFKVLSLSQYIKKLKNNDEIKKNNNYKISKSIKLLYVTLIIFIMNYFLFNFQILPNYRDFLALNYFYNLELNFSLIYFFRFFVNFFSNFDINILLIYKLFFSFCISVSFLIFSYSFLLLLPIINFSFSKINIFFTYILAFFCTYNSWTFERILMGQVGIILSASIFCLIFVYLIYILKMVLCKKNIIYESFIFMKYTLHFIILNIAIIFISPHYSVVSISIFVILIFISFFKNFNLKSFFKHVSLLFFVLFILLNFLFIKGYGITQNNFYNKLEDNKKIEIIESFSLSNINDNNFYINSIIGKNSWMTNNFTEILKIKNDINIFSNFSIYFNNYIVYIFTIFIFLSVFIFIYKNNKYSFDKKIINYFILLFLILFFILNFGLSESIFYHINSLFFNLPFSYMFREAGKFFILFLILLSFIFLFNFVNQKKYKSLTLLFFISLSLSSFFPFIKLSANLGVKNPMFINEINNFCTEKEKMLILPNKTYKNTYPDDVFVIAPNQKFFTCDIVKNPTINIEHPKTKKNIIIYQNNNYDEVSDLIGKFIIQEGDYSVEHIALVEKLRQKNIRFILIDTYLNKDMQIFVNKFLHFNPVFLSEGNFYIFDI